MPEKKGRTDAVLYAISVGKATVDGCLKLQSSGKPPPREWLITVGSTLDIAKAEIERLSEALNQERDRPRDE